MKHLTITERGFALGCSGARLIIKEKGKEIGYQPLNRLKTVTIAKRGVSISSDLICACAQRGIRLFFLDFRGQPCACLEGGAGHAVTAVRDAQFEFIHQGDCSSLAAGMVYGKMRNQRAVLLYVSKYLNRTGSSNLEAVKTAAEKIESLAAQAHNTTPIKDWRSKLMGTEGQASHLYWQALAESQRMPESFKKRIGRGAPDPANQAINYGYAILQSYIWHAVLNAGLESYAGIYHTERPGKPSLVLDLIEEYRAWVVDRQIIKLRTHFEHPLNQDTKKKLIGAIHDVFAHKYQYHGKKVMLETILQRQVYRLSGHLMGKQKYKPYLFKW